MSNELETIDALCDVAERLVDITRRQAALLQQLEATGAMFPGNLAEERERAENDFKRITRGDI